MGGPQKLDLAVSVEDLTSRCLELLVLLNETKKSGVGFENIKEKTQEFVTKASEDLGALYAQSLSFAETGGRIIAHAPGTGVPHFAYLAQRYKTRTKGLVAVWSRLLEEPAGINAAADALKKEIKTLNEFVFDEGLLPPKIKIETKKEFKSFETAIIKNPASALTFYRKKRRIPPEFWEFFAEYVRWASWRGDAVWKDAPPSAWDGLWALSFELAVCCLAVFLWVAFSFVTWGGVVLMHSVAKEPLDPFEVLAAPGLGYLLLLFTMQKLNETTLKKYWKRVQKIRSFDWEAYEDN